MPPKVRPQIQNLRWHSPGQAAATQPPASPAAATMAQPDVEVPPNVEVPRTHQPAYPPTHLVCAPRPYHIYPPSIHSEPGITGRFVRRDVNSGK